MNYRTYVVMLTDECGDVRRAYGSSRLEGTYKFPDFDEFNDSPMVTAFSTWIEQLEYELQSEWEQLFGDECHIFLEEEYTSQWKRLGGASLCRL